MPSFSRLFPVLVSLTCVASAQIGDRADKAGEVQKSLVPADQIPAAPALTPEEALKTFTVAPGYKLELAAAEPLVQEPVAVVFGADGRLWVVEMRGYMPDLDGTGEDAPVGRVVVLRDRDGDGRFEDRTVFVDQLVLPRAVLPVADGALVGAPPELAFWQDTNGDGKADKKTVVATDYGVRVDPKRPHLANPERAPNGLLWAYDNWIYSAAYTKKFRYVNGEWETASTLFRGQWGLSQDDFGRFYSNSNSDQMRIDVIFSDYLTRNANYPRLTGTNVNAAENQFVWPARVTPGINRGYRPEMLREGRLKEFTAACAPWVYRGDLMPELQGNVFVAEPAAHFVRRNVMTAGEGSVKGRNAYDTEKREFIASTDERFRPVNFTTGPDGALYVVDLYRGVLQHRISLTSYLRKQSEDRKLVDPHHLGRIYRIVPADRAVPSAARTEGETVAKTGGAKMSPAQWVARLAHPNAFWRETAQRVLVERKKDVLAAKDVVASIRALATKSDVPAQGRVSALWTLQGLDALDQTTVFTSLAATDAEVRAAAIRAGEGLLKGEASARKELATRLLVLASDASPEVQLQAVLTLGEARDGDVDYALAGIVEKSPKNTFLRDALFSGLQGRELALLERLATQRERVATDGEANRILNGLARGVMGSRQPAAIARVFALAAEQTAPARARTAALLEGLFAGVGTSKRPVVFENEPAGWAALAKDPAQAQRLTKLKDSVSWPGKELASVAKKVEPLTPEQQKRFEAGKVLYANICAACHQANGSGLEGLAPPLADSEWVLGPAARTTRIVLHGVRGPIRVLGKIHTGDMPPMGGALNDEQLSSVLTYLRREWGHDASPVEPEQVKAIREATKNHTDAWSPEELMEFK